MNTTTFSQAAVRDLSPYSNNARKHSKKQIKQVAESIQTFGFINPVVVDGKNTIVAGHARVAAAQLLGLETVPTIRVEHLCEAQLRAYMLADNKLAENATWDEQALKIELLFLDNLDLDFDLEITGFSTAETDLILSDTDTDDGATKSAIIDVLAEPIVQLGDIFAIGNHRIMCGDCRDPLQMDTLMDGQLADAVCTDPPYNVSIKGHVLSGSTTHEEFRMASGEMTSGEFTDFLFHAMTSLHRASRDGSVHFLFIDWRHVTEMITASNRIYDTFLNLCVWVKSNGGMGSLYRSRHELAFVFRKGKAQHRNNVELGRNGRYRTNVWEYAGMNAFRSDRAESLGAHPTVKPVEMIRDAIMDVTKRGDIVLDTFLGSGTTLLAADDCGRRCYGVEIDPRYVEVAITRFAKKTDVPVVHVASGLTFDELTRQRRNSADGES